MTTLRRWLLFVVAATVWTLFFFPWDPNTSFEGNPLAGPLISFLYHSPVWPDRIIGAIITPIWLFAIFCPILRKNVVTCILSGVSVLAWFGMSVWAAGVASA